MAQQTLLWGGGGTVAAPVWNQFTPSFDGPGPRKRLQSNGPPASRRHPEGGVRRVRKPASANAAQETIRRGGQMVSSQADFSSPPSVPAWLHFLAHQLAFCLTSQRVQRVLRPPLLPTAARLSHSLSLSLSPPALHLHVLSSRLLSSSVVFCPSHTSQPVFHP